MDVSFKGVWSVYGESDAVTKYIQEKEKEDVIEYTTILGQGKSDGYETTIIVSGKDLEAVCKDIPCAQKVIDEINEEKSKAENNQLSANLIEKFNQSLRDCFTTRKKALFLAKRIDEYYKNCCDNGNKDVSGRDVLHENVPKSPYKALRRKILERNGKQTEA